LVLILFIIIKKAEFISLNLFVAEGYRPLDSASTPLILVSERANV